jgi:acyl carrier protein
MQGVSNVSETEIGATTPAAIGTALAASLAGLLQCDQAEIDLSAPLAELPGMDSMKLVEVVVECEQYWQVELDEDQLYEIRTGDDLCALVRSALAPAERSA